MAGTYVVVGFVSFQMLIVVVEADVAASKRFGSFLVVFDMVGLKALVSIMNVHIPVSDE
jgi:hypothetical protein